ncbi:hypothetical protein ACIQOW_06115 [Kitasatospora sp. NPDC091335]|uniref:hypothetical protein n=1 Tax=Kitasatospora sp. NPDC091335 TaxID=3364085 RepID=UPI00381A8AC0
MAATAPPPRRRRPGAVPVLALAGLIVLAGLAALAIGPSTPGGLRDQGPAQAVTPPPERRLLWSQLPASPAPTTPEAGSATQEPPKPVPDLTVPGRDITAVDVHAVLAKDPAVGPEERQALGSCTGCEVRTPEFRDLTGDGQPELITAVTTPGRTVLHVYALAEDRLLPLLQVQVQPAFSAATIGSELWLYELTSAYVRTTSHYVWDGSRLLLKDRKDEGAALPPPTGGESGRPATTTAEPEPPRPGADVPKALVPTAVPTPRTARPSAGPPAGPSVPAVQPEAKR